MAGAPLSPDQEQEAQALKAKLRSAIDAEVEQLARLLVSRKPHEIFGQTEFDIRDIVHKIGAKALEEHLREKKTATKAPE